MLKIKKIDMWEKFTDWTMQTLYPEIDKYHKQLPHLSKSITDPLAKVIVFLFTLNLYLSLVALVLSPFYLFMGISGVFLILYLLTFIVLGFSFKDDVTKYTQKGWEYLFALSVLELCIMFLQNGIGAIVSPVFVIPFLFGFIVKAIIVVYLLFEIKSEFNK